MSRKRALQEVGGRFGRAWPILAACALPFATAGCGKHGSAVSYAILSGKVTACHFETSEWAVRVSRRTAGGTAEDSLFAVVTKDSEIYVNDRLSTFADIQVGDTLELVGYRDPNPSLEPFVVSFAYCNRGLPPAPPPPVGGAGSGAGPSQAGG